GAARRQPFRHCPVGPRAPCRAWTARPVGRRPGRSFRRGLERFRWICFSHPVSNVAWRAQPPEEASDEPAEVQEGDAEVVDLTKQRLLGWVKGMFGGRKQPHERDKS